MQKSTTTLISSLLPPPSKLTPLLKKDSWTSVLFTVQLQVHASQLMKISCLRCFSKLLFVFLVLSSLMDLQCWWTAANSKWIEYVSWRGMLSVRIGRNHSKKKWFPPKCYLFSDRRLQYWLGRLNLFSNIVTPFQPIKSNFGNNFLLYNYITEAISSGHTVLIVEGKSGFELVNLTWWSAYLELFIVCYDAKLTLAYEQSLFFSK